MLLCSVLESESSIQNDTNNSLEENGPSLEVNWFLLCIYRIIYNDHNNIVLMM